ncbi:unnamed protein product [Arabidopsis lyrata]|uniref:Bet v I/Major latex protein domain-containing protein n=1 Tax=Arabidopsis lyrata subsp. lyrata TaxID=81972 RepID=D7KYF8_ARALL|nr:hypothetical protein ARALYDRAFT_476224 [Arabidopsis lyrata subsp. lyrata]CAH8257775.1 unnamed protein product [Arabidopsis lyrata]
MAEASSLVGKLETEVEIKASAGKFHHMFAGDHTMSPKQLQIKFMDVSCTKATGAKSALSSSGNTFMANGKLTVAKNRIDAVDPEKNLITFKVLEGDLMKEYKSFAFTIQVTPKQGAPGSIVHWHLDYEKISEEVAHPETLLQFCVEISKEIDEHLLSEE